MEAGAWERFIEIPVGFTVVIVMFDKQMHWAGHEHAVFEDFLFSTFFVLWPLS